MPDNFAQSVKQQADIVKIIGEFVRLKKAGAQNYTGLCPFHSEKTPSFSVHAGRQFYHCFGCGQSGDVFSFIQKIENVSFPEAVKTVAVKCGIPLPKREFSSAEEAAESRQRGKLIELHEAAAAWFEQQLRSPEGALAREYLTGRGMTEEGIAKFRIGYAPDSFNALRDRLQSLADTETLRASGLFSFKEQEDGSPGHIYSRFRKRITFPIASESGRIIAFTARALDSGDKAGAKYINSPETPLYTKGHVLFNLDKARQSIREADFAVLVEGQMDCISAYLAGITNILATSGTAFTEAQVRLLRRYTSRVIVNFDPDTAGANAAEKSIALLTEEGFDIKVVTLEDGLDPDRYIRERGAKEYMAALRGARRYQDYLLERARQLFPPRTPDARIKALNFLLPHIRRMPSRIARDEFAMDAAQKLGIDSALVREELKQAAAKRRDSLGGAGPRPSPVPSRFCCRRFPRRNRANFISPPRRPGASTSRTSRVCAKTCAKCSTGSARANPMPTRCRRSNPNSVRRSPVCWSRFTGPILNLSTSTPLSLRCAGPLLSRSSAPSAWLCRKRNAPGRWRKFCR